MSRIGKKPVAIPAKVDVKIDGQEITVKGPKGELKHTVHPLISIQVENGEAVVVRPNDEPKVRALHGLTRALLANPVPA